MTYRSSALLWLFALALFFYLFLGEKRIPTAENGQRGHPFLKESPETIQALTFSSDAGKIRVEKTKEKTWQVTKPILDLADQERIEAILSQLEYAKIARVLEEENPSYGLSSPSATLSIEREEKKSITILFGNDAIGGQYIYAKQENSSQILLLPKNLKEITTLAPSQLRQKQAIPFSRASLLQIESTIGKETVRIFQKNNRWMISSPVQGRLAPTKLESLLLSLESLVILEFLDQKNSPSETGLEDPKSFIRVKTEKEEFTLLLGKQEDSQTSKIQYAKRQNFPGIFTLPVNALQPLQTQQTTLRDQRFFPYQFSEIQSLRFKSPHASFFVERSEKGWQSNPPKELDPIELEKFLETLSGLSVLSFSPVTENKKQLASLEVTLLGENTQSDQFVLYASDLPNSLWATRQDEGVQVEVPQKVLSWFLPDPLRFVSRQILRLQVKDARLLEIIRPDETVLLQKEGETWRLSSPHNAIADQRTLEGILEYFEELRAVRFFSKENSLQTGLESPRYQVRLELFAPDGTKTDYRLLLGLPYQEGEIFAKLSNRDELFTLPSQIEDLLLANLVERRPFLSLDLQEINGISLNSSDTNLDLARTQTGWKTSSFPTKEFSQDSILSYLSDIVDTHAKFVIEDTEASLAKYGMTIPQLEAELRNNTKTISFVVGSLSDKQGYFALRIGEGPLYLISKEELQYLQNDDWYTE